MAARYDFANLIGDVFRRTITLKDENGDPIPLTNCVVTMSLKSSRRSNAVVYKAMTTADDTTIILTDPTNGTLELYLSPTVTAPFDFRTAVYDLQVQFPNTDAITYLSGEYNTFEGAIEQGDGSTAISGTGEITVVTVGVMGPPGIAGTAGGAAVAGEIISADKVVVLVGGQLFHADPTNLAHAGKVVGIATQSGSMGSTIQYQQAGEVPGGSYTQDSIYFLGLNGVLSTTADAVGAAFSQLIGYAKTSSVFVVNMGIPIALS